MKIIAILLIISSLTKFYMSATSNELEIKDLIHDMPFNFEIANNIIKAVLIFDGLICLLSGIFILCL